MGVIYKYAVNSPYHEKYLLYKTFKEAREYVLGKFGSGSVIFKLTKMHSSVEELKEMTDPDIPVIEIQEKYPNLYVLKCGEYYWAGSEKWIKDDSKSLKHTWNGVQYVRDTLTYAECYPPQEKE